MPAFRTRHCLAGMTVFNLYGISAFIAVKNHPASSTEPKNQPHPHQSSTRMKKYFIIYSLKSQKNPITTVTIAPVVKQ
jgi:hypothetical protein